MDKETQRTKRIFSTRFRDIFSGRERGRGNISEESKNENGRARIHKSPGRLRYRESNARRSELIIPTREEVDGDPGQVELSRAKYIPEKIARREWRCIDMLLVGVVVGHSHEILSGLHARMSPLTLPSIRRLLNELRIKRVEEKKIRAKENPTVGNYMRCARLKKKRMVKHGSKHGR